MPGSTFCTSCGAELTSSSDVFCRTCGSRMRAEPAEQAVESPTHASVNHQGTLSRPWVRWVAGFAFGAIVLAVATASMMRNAEGDESPTTPSGQSINATNEDDALVEGFVAGCDETYTASECVCISDVVFAEYTADEFRQTIKDYGNEQGIVRLLEPIQASADGCIAPTSVPSVSRTAPEVLRAVEAIAPGLLGVPPGITDWCFFPSATTQVRGPKQQPDGNWVVECFLRIPYKEPRDDGTPGHISHWCVLVNDGTLEVTLREPSDMTPFKGADGWLVTNPPCF